MKKLLVATLLILALLLSTALAETIALPDPGHYFGLPYKNGEIAFDAYPKAEFDAYTTLLTNKYGLKITYKNQGAQGEYYLLDKPGVKNSRVTITCYSNSKGHYLDFKFSNSYELKKLDVAKQQAAKQQMTTQQTAKPQSDIVWNGGRMVADPGDFLGYEIPVIDTLDMTSYDYGGNYFTREYAEVDIQDIWKYIDALENSPYFKICKTTNGKSASYVQIHFEYIGTDAELAASCKEGRRNSKRASDIYVQIHYRDRERSTFRIVTYPEIAVNSPDTAIVTPSAPAPNGQERCVFCDKGRCKTCGGGGFVYQYAAGYKDQKRKVDCSSCMSGRCFFCDGDGWK